MQISNQIRDWIKGQLRIKVQILKHNPCYLWVRDKGRTRQPQGVMVHSTGANNPRLSRYIAPDDGEIGTPSPRHWNQDNGNKGVHAFIGKLADGSVAVRQTLPWTYEGWHCAGHANRTHIGFECCEDSLDPNKLECWTYFADVYKQAALLTAHLCARYGLDPRKPGVVICHCEGHKLGVASNHADVLHWWPRFGRNMDDLRRDVWALMQGQQIPDVQIPAHLLPKPKPAPKPTTDKDRKDVYTMDITRAELIKLIQDTTRAELAKQATETAKAPASDWAEEAIAAAETWGLTSDGSRPCAYAQRQEVLTMLVRVVEVVTGLPHDQITKALQSISEDVPNLGTAKECDGDSCPIPEVSNVDTYDPDADHVAECSREV